MEDEYKKQIRKALEAINEAQVAFGALPMDKMLNTIRVDGPAGNCGGGAHHIAQLHSQMSVLHYILRGELERS